MRADSNTSYGGVTFASSFTATQVYINSSGLGSAATAYFNANSTFTVTTLTLTGASGKLVTLRSGTPGTNWMLNNTGSNAVSFTDAKDSEARPGALINDTNGGVDSGNNNKNWNF